MQVVSEDVGLSLDKIDMSVLGSAKKVSISKDDTIILDGGGSKDAINERSDQIREAISASSSDYDRCARGVLLSCCHMSSPDLIGCNPMLPRVPFPGIQV